jgi:hypothetical protein
MQKCPARRQIGGKRAVSRTTQKFSDETEMNRGARKPLTLEGDSPQKSVRLALK